MFFIYSLRLLSLQRSSYQASRKLKFNVSFIAQMFSLIKKCVVYILENVILSVLHL